MSSPYFVELHNAYIYSLPVAFTIIYTRIVVKSRDSESRPPECTTDLQVDYLGLPWELRADYLNPPTMGYEGSLPGLPWNLRVIYLDLP